MPDKVTLMKSMLILHSYHHNNTEKIAKVIARVLDAQIKALHQTNPDELHGMDLIGFGSGIDSDKHYQALLDFADSLPQFSDKDAFIFSTSAVTGEDKLAGDHLALREVIQCRGFRVVGEFQCLGFNTNGFLRYFGGMNRGRPNAEDLKRAEEFALMLRQRLGKM